MSDAAEQSLFSELIHELVSIIIKQSDASYRIVGNNRKKTDFILHDLVSELEMNDFIRDINTVYQVGNFTDSEYIIFIKVIGDILVNASNTNTNTMTMELTSVSSTSVLYLEQSIHKLSPLGLISDNL